MDVFAAHFSLSPPSRLWALGWVWGARQREPVALDGGFSDTFLEGVSNAVASVWGVFVPFFLPCLFLNSSCAFFPLHTWTSWFL